MADIQFQEPQYGRSDFAGPRRSRLTNLVIRWGLANDERSAQWVLLGIAVLAVVLTFVIPSLLSVSSPHVPQADIDAAIRTMNARPPSSRL